jgi:predicted nucleotidyltransferase
MKLTDLLQKRRSDILRVAEQHGASNVRIFGSVARGEDDERSDIDLLVDLESGRGLLDHAALILDLEELLGRKVDVATERGLRSLVRQRALQDATPL